MSPAYNLLNILSSQRWPWPQVREEEFASEAAERVTARKAYMLHASASKFAGIQSSRIKTMRQLIEARK